MAGKTQTLRFKRTVSAPAAEVYLAFTNSTALREWLCNAATVDARKDGRIHLWWNGGYYTTGEYTALAPNKKVAFTWRGKTEPDKTQVQVSLAEKNGKTTLTLTHTAGTGKAWAKAVEEFARGWEMFLENLQSVLETGQDLRLTRRPMLGIMVGVFNAEVAARLGVPVREGVLLDNTVEGMGAHAAGLQKGDVIVSIGGRKTSNSPALANAVQPHRAGETVKVVLYRGGEKVTLPMTLSPRQLPEVPATAKELSEAVRRLYDQIDTDLAKAFVGVSEAEAGHPPAPNEWSAKNVVCHLIEGERYTHQWIVELVGGYESQADDWPGNLTLGHEGLLAAYPSVPLLLEELHRQEVETVAMLAKLPDDFVARKRSYWRLGTGLLQPMEHVRGHIEQIQAAIASARR
jgi:uncharacterized protein YndB with AHSA1/START domain